MGLVLYLGYVPDGTGLCPHTAEGFNFADLGDCGTCDDEVALGSLSYCSIFRGTMKIILHIGLPKTASSYIQEWLRINSDAVASLPIHLATRLATECCDSEKFGARPDFVFHQQTHVSAVEECLSLLAANGAERIVISSEYFYLASPSSISQVFRRLGLRVEKAICFLRRQDGLLASGYAQDIKGLSRTEPFDLETCRDVYDWLQLQTDYLTAFPDAHFSPLPFEHLRSSGTLLARWKAEIGCDAATLDTLPNGDTVNVSLPGELVEVCRAANEAGDRSLVDFALCAARDGIVTSTYKLPRSVQLELHERFAPLNDLFFANLDNTEGFESYTSRNWVVDEADMPANLSPEIVARLLMLATSGRCLPAPRTSCATEAKQRVSVEHSVRAHGHAFRGPKHGR